MKKTSKITLALVTVGAFTLAIQAQDAGQPGPRNRGQRPPPPPIVQALDTNHDGIIDSNEIANAPAALLKLDKNGDGRLTPDEFDQPRPPRRQRGTNDIDFHPDGPPDGPPQGAPADHAEGPNQHPPGPGQRGDRPIMPLIRALDVNHDGIIDADEIANAPAALRALDKNGDGRLTPDEFAPPRPPRRTGPGRPGGPDAYPGGLDSSGRGGNPPTDRVPPGPPPGDDQ